MTRMHRYTTHAQAEADAERISDAPFGAGNLARHLRHMLADPRSGSDMLLLVADALRASAGDPQFHPPAQRASMMRWADTLTSLAQTRANPIEDGS
jgi:hypothetical protein